jgi:hypothetical protein
VSCRANARLPLDTLVAMRIADTIRANPDHVSLLSNWVDFFLVDTESARGV